MSRSIRSSKGLVAVVLSHMFLCGSAGVFAASPGAPVAAPSQAQAPVLKISGFTALQASTSSQKSKVQKKGTGKTPHFSIGVSDIYLNAEGKTAGGLEYLYRISLEGTPGESAFVDKNYVQFNDLFGSIQFGAVSGISDALPESGFNLMGGSTGIDGALNGVYNMSSGVIGGVHMMLRTRRATKIVYYSPRVLGFQLGADYTPNTSVAGNAHHKPYAIGANPTGYPKAIYPGEDRPYGIGNTSVGLNYSNAWDKWSLNLAAVMMMERTRYKGNYQTVGYIPMRRSKAYELTAAIGYDRFRIAAGWIDNLQARLPKGNGLASYIGNNAYKGNSGRAWNVGAKYVVEAYELAAGFFRTDRKNNDTKKTSSDIVTLTIDRNVMQGLKFFGEVDVLATRTNTDAIAVEQSVLKDGIQATPNNRGVVLTAGTKISF